MPDEIINRVHNMVCRRAAGILVANKNDIEYNDFEADAGDNSSCGSS